MTSRLTKPAIALLLISLSLSCCGGTPEQKEARYLKRGLELFDQKSFEKARVEFLNAARLKPADVEPMYQLGMVDDAEGNFRDAFTAFTNAEQQDKHFEPALIKLAEYYLAGGLYDEAMQRLNAALADNPNDPQAHALLGARFLRLKQYDEAETEARKALSAAPNNVIAFAILTGIYRSLNNTEKARATIEDGIARNPKNETLLHTQAEFYEQQNDVAQAAAAYQTLFTVAPAEKKYRLQLSALYIKSGQKDLAEKVLRDGVAALPDDWEMKHQLVLFLNDQRGIETAAKEIHTDIKAATDREEPIDWLVNLYLAHNMQNEASAFLNEIISQNVHDKAWLNAMTSQARIDYLKQDKDAAFKLIAQVLEKDPNNLSANFIKATIEADQGLYKQAVIDLRGLLRDQPKAKEAYGLLSEILLRQGHADLAIDTLNQLNEIEPLNVAQRVRLAQIYALNGDPKHAMDLLFIATKTDPDYSVGWEMTARVALEQKNWSTVDAAIDRLDALPGQHPTALLLRGNELAATGKTTDAISTYTTLINTDPSAPQAEYALRELMQTYQGTNQLADAAHYLESLHPATPLISTLLGECYLELGNEDKAAAAFDQAIAAHAPEQEPYLERAKLDLREHKSEAALAVLEKTPSSTTADMRVLFAEAEIHEQLGHYDQANKIYSALLDKFPDSDVVANNLAELIADTAYTDKPQLERARQIAERFTESQNPVLLDTLGWIYFRQGRSQDALSLMERAAALSATLPPQFHYHYGAVLQSLGKRDQAISELQQATAKGAPYPGRDEAQTALAALSGKR